MQEPPEFFVLENVEGVLRSGKGGLEPPIKFIEDGVLEWNGIQMKVGLNHMEDKYLVLPHFEIQANTFGLPFRRGRVLWVLLRRAGKSQAQLDSLAAGILKNMQLIQSNPMNFHGVTQFMKCTYEEDDEEGGGGDADDAVQQQNSRHNHKRQRIDGAYPMTLLSVGKSNQMRQRLRLPLYHSEHGKPHSRLPAIIALRDQLKLTDLELDVLDFAFFAVQCDLARMRAVAVDVSQSPERRPWKENGLPSISRRSKIIIDGLHLSQEDLFCCMGWERDRFCIPEGTPSTSVKLMIANMLCPPVAGGLMLATIAANANTTL